jgi:hypothetical protein
MAAAANPEAQAALAGIVQRDAANPRAAVHTFDPDASPEEKAAAAGKGREKLAAVNHGAQDGAQGQGACRDRVCRVRDRPAHTTPHPPPGCVYRTARGARRRRAAHDYHRRRR